MMWWTVLPSTGYGCDRMGSGLQTVNGFGGPDQFCCAAQRSRNANASRLSCEPSSCCGTGVTEYSAGAGHSGLMFAARITLRHFSVSSAINLPKSAGESASTSPPRSASRVLILGSARPVLISRLSLSIISAGVFLGAPSPSRLIQSD